MNELQYIGNNTIIEIYDIEGNIAFLLKDEYVLQL